MNLNVRESARQSADEVVKIWETTRIPIVKKTHVIEKIESLYNEWRGLMRNIKRQTDNEVGKRNCFSTKLDHLLDISKQNALTELKKSSNPALSEDAAFLEAQLEIPRRGIIGGVDQKQTSLETREMKKILRKADQTQIMLKRREIDEAKRKKLGRYFYFFIVRHF